MNIFKNKFLIKLIATLCLFLALISFGAPTTVHADPGDDDDGWGGVLITPVVKLLTAFGDGVMELLHSSVQSQKLSMIKIDGSADWTNILGFFGAALVTILVAAAVIAATVALGGAAAFIAAKIGLEVAFGTTISLGLVATAGVTGILAGTAVYDGWIPDDIYLPAFSVTAEEIFSNEILLFDINFFDIDESDPDSYSKEVATGSVSVDEKYDVNMTIYYGKFDHVTAMQTITEDELSGFDIILGPNQILGNRTNLYSLLIKDEFKDHANGKPISIQKLKEYMQGNAEEAGKLETLNTIISKANEALGTTSIIDNSQIYITVKENGDNKKCWLGVTVGSPQTGGPKHVVIFLDVTDTNTTESTVVTQTVYSTAYQLHGVVSKWYYILRNLALLVLMVVLIYTGIRIVLASTAGDKAKYKERLIDWIVAMCLLFVMNYIMIFAVELVDRITDLVKDASGTNGNFTLINLTDEQSKNAKSIFEDDEYGKMLVEKGVANLSSDGKQLIWMSDLAGLFRLQSQLTNEGSGKWVGYSFSYVVLVLFTLFFAWTYLKRIVYMAFLTMIAPLVAMTYPIDKISDGKAQAFNSWLKEYIFNLLIQPMHLLLYSVLVSSAFQLASDSAIYALVALGFMLPAEKLIRKFFGFEKASTPGLLGGAAGAALAMTGINKLLGHRPRGGSSGGKSSGGNESKDSAKINFKSKDAVSGMKGIAGHPTEDGQIQDSEDSNIRTNEPETEERGNPRINPSRADEHSSLAEDIFEDMYGPDPNVSRATDDHSALAEDIFEDMYGQKPNEPTQNEQPKQEMPEINIAEQLQKQRNEQEWNEFNKERLKKFDMGRHINGTIASSGAYYRALGKRIGDKIQNGHPVRALARGAAGLAGAATFGAAGLAMGVVSGDPSKAFQYASAGALGGHKLASSTVGALQKATSVDEDYLKEQYELSAYGNEYKNYILEQEKQKMQENEKYINYLQKTMSLSRGQAENVLKTTGSKCFDAGITNVEDIATIHKMTEGKDGISINEAIGAKKFNDLLPSDVSKMSSKKRGEYITTWTEDYKKAGYGSKSGDWAQKSMDYAIKFADTQSSLKKSQV